MRLRVSLSTPKEEVGADAAMGAEDFPLFLSWNWSMMSRYVRLVPSWAPIEEEEGGGGGGGGDGVQLERMVVILDVLIALCTTVLSLSAFSFTGDW